MNNGDIFQILRILNQHYLDTKKRATVLTGELAKAELANEDTEQLKEAVCAAKKAATTAKSAFLAFEQHEW